MQYDAVANQTSARLGHVVGELLQGFLIASLSNGKVKSLPILLC